MCVRACVNHQIFANPPGQSLGNPPPPSPRYFILLKKISFTPGAKTPMKRQCRLLHEVLRDFHGAIVLRRDKRHPRFCFIFPPLAPFFLFRSGRNRRRCSERRLWGCRKRARRASASSRTSTRSTRSSSTSAAWCSASSAARYDLRSVSCPGKRSLHHHPRLWCYSNPAPQASIAALLGVPLGDVFSIRGHIAQCVTRLFRLADDVGLITWGAFSGKT